MQWISRRCSAHGESVDSQSYATTSVAEASSAIPNRRLGWRRAYSTTRCFRRAVGQSAGPGRPHDPVLWKKRRLRLAVSSIDGCAEGPVRAPRVARPAVRRSLWDSDRIPWQVAVSPSRRAWGPVCSYRTGCFVGSSKKDEVPDVRDPVGSQRGSVEVSVRGRLGAACFGEQVSGGTARALAFSTATDRLISNRHLLHGVGFWSRVGTG